MKPANGLDGGSKRIEDAAGLGPVERRRYGSLLRRSEVSLVKAY